MSRIIILVLNVVLYVSVFCFNFYEPGFELTFPGSRTVAPACFVLFIVNSSFCFIFPSCVTILFLLCTHLYLPPSLPNYKGNHIRSRRAARVDVGRTYSFQRFSSFLHLWTARCLGTPRIHIQPRAAFVFLSTF